MLQNQMDMEYFSTNNNIQSTQFQQSTQTTTSSTDINTSNNSNTNDSGTQLPTPNTNGTLSSISSDSYGSLTLVASPVKNSNRLLPVLTEELTDHSDRSQLSNKTIKVQKQP